MRLRARVLVPVSLLLVVLSSCLYLAATRILTQGFAETEFRATEHAVHHTNATIDDLISRLQIIGGDWAQWDDTCRYIEDGNPAFVQSNITVTSLTTIHTDWMLFLHRDGRVIGDFTQAADGESANLMLNVQAPLLDEHLPVLTHHEKAGAPIAGVLLVAGSPCIVSSWPIVDSNGAGPIRGTLIVGRRINADVLESLHRHTNSTIRLHRLHQDPVPEAVLAALLGGEPQVIDMAGSETATGWSLRRDLYGRPAVLIENTTPRLVERHVTASLRYLLASVVVVSIASIVTILVLLDRLVIRRIQRLARGVEGIRANGKPSERLQVDGGDELGQLTASVNSMLESLETAENKHRAAFENATDGQILMTDRFLDCNSQSCLLFGCDRENIIGRTPADFSPPFQPDGRRSAEASRERIEVARSGHPQRFYWQHRRKDGSLVECEVSLVPIILGGQRSVHATVRDITEQKRAELQVHQSREQLQLVLEGSNDGFWDWNMTTDTIQFSPRWCEILGYEVEEIEPRLSTFQRLVHPDDWPMLEGNIQTHVRGETPQVSAEFRMRCRNGEWKWILGRGKVVKRDDTGKPLRMTGTHLDITERKQAQEALRTSEELFRSISDSAQDAIVMIDPEGRIVVWNRAAETMFGFSANLALGAGLHDLILPQRYHQDHLERLSRFGTAPTGEGVGKVIELTARRADGQELPIELSLSGMRLQDKWFAVGIIRDITERRRAEEAIRQSEEHFRLLSDSGPAMLWMASQDMKCTWFNKAWLAFTGRTLDQDRGSGWSEGIHPEDLERTLRHYTTSFVDRQSFEIEYRLRRADGRYRWVLDRGIPRYSDSGEFIGYLGSAIDIDVRKQIEDRLRESNNMLADTIEREKEAKTQLMAVLQQLRSATEAANAATQAKSQFLANMSHEIRTPMTAILGYTDSLLEESQSADESPERLKALTTIQRNGRHLLAIINDILDFSKIEAGKLAIEQIRYSPLQILAEIESLESVNAARKNLRFEVKALSPMPATITTDPTRLRQVLANLVNNAIKFTQQGSVKLQAQFLAAEPADYPRIQFDVLDTGVGISPEQREQLFRPFTQADASTTRQFGGTGLGLVISRQITQLLSGSIEIVDSAPDRGTHIRVTIPTGSLEGVSTRDNCETFNMEDFGQKNRAPATTGSLRCRILLAEDSEDNSDFISAMLRRAGAEVVLVENGQLAVDQALGGILNRRASDPPQPYDIILMDMQMPVMDGYEATRQLREKGYSGKIIALTAHALSSDRDKCLAAGCDDYAIKPINRHEFFQTIQRNLSALATAPAPPAAPRPKAPEPAPPGASEPARSTTPPTAAGSGKQVLSSQRSCDPAFAPLIQAFLGRLPKRIEAFEQALAAHDLSILTMEAHKLKGAAGNYGFTALSKAAGDIERDAKAQCALDVLQQEVKALIELCHQTRAENPPAPNAANAAPQ